MRIRNISALIGGLLFLLVFITACGSSNNDGIDLIVETRDVAAPTTAPSSGYPVVDTANNSYPGAANSADSQIALEDILTELPDGVELPTGDPTKGTIGGILVREITDQGFLPVTPYEMILAKPLYGSSGNLTYVRHSGTSMRAQLLPTGIFIFENVPPGEYGFVADLVVSQQTLRGEDGEPIFVTIAAGQAIDLGVIMVELAAPEESE